MSDAFGSIISNNLNTTMKFLAGVTIVLMLPTIIAGLYGMNVELPGAELKGAFLMLGGLCLGLMLAVSILFAKKKWF
jgi:Mg2+ and Co2+ transporters